MGVLEWLEEHHIPVDVVVGTSMGGLIGGAYASGMSPAEIRTFLATTDWDLMFLGEVPYQQRDLRRREDRRVYPMRVEFGLKGGFKLPPGLDSGQQVTFLLQRIALPYYAVTSFDELPTPFRCVATDMEKGEPVVLGSGSLARAMRATMSLPTAFAPVVIDGRLLADGGILNNVPVDVARAQGADVVIAVNVGSAPHTREQMMSLFGMLGQTLDVAMSDSSRAIASTADVLVQPAVGQIGSLDFRKSRGDRRTSATQGASEVTALLKYAVDDATWNQWVQARAARRRVDPPVPGVRAHRRRRRQGRHHRDGEGSGAVPRQTARPGGARAGPHAGHRRRACSARSPTTRSARTGAMGCSCTSTRSSPGLHCSTSRSR